MGNETDSLWNDKTGDHDFKCNILALASLFSGAYCSRLKYERGDFLVISKYILIDRIYLNSPYSELLHIEIYSFSLVSRPKTNF